LPKCGAQSSENKTITYSYRRSPSRTSDTFIAGYNKWSKVKRIKGALEAKRERFSHPPVKEVAFDKNNDVFRVYSHFIFSALQFEGLSRSH
jgi:hypothetical protein